LAGAGASQAEAPALKARDWVNRFRVVSWPAAVPAWLPARLRWQCVQVLLV